MNSNLPFFTFQGTSSQSRNFFWAVPTSLEFVEWMKLYINVRNKHNHKLIFHLYQLQSAQTDHSQRSGSRLGKETHGRRRLPPNSHNHVHVKWMKRWSLGYGAFCVGYVFYFYFSKLRWICLRVPHVIGQTPPEWWYSKVHSMAPTFLRQSVVFFSLTRDLYRLLVQYKFVVLLSEEKNCRVMKTYHQQTSKKITL